MGKMAIIWRAWRGIVFAEREKKIEFGRRKRVRDRALMRETFKAWVEETHFIYRRGSWRGGGLGGGGRNVLTDRSTFMTNYLNNNARQDMLMKGGATGARRKVGFL